MITQQFPASGPIPRAEVAPRRAHHPIHTLVRNTSRRTSERLDIDFRFQFNAVTISQARSSNTNFVLSDFSCDVPVPCSSNASRARDTRGRASRQSRETRKASRRLMNILDDNYIDISVDFQCRRTWSRSSMRTGTRRPWRLGRIWRATIYDSPATSMAVSIVKMECAWRQRFFQSSKTTWFSVFRNARLVYALRNRY